MAFTLRVRTVGYEKCRFELSTCRGSATSITTDKHILIVDGVVFNWKPIEMMRHLESVGVDFLQALDGLFVLVLFEKVTNRAMVLRDPLGRRTAFVSNLQDGYCISNQPEEFNASPESSNLRIASYLGVCEFPPEMTYHVGVMEISAGTCYELQCGGRCHLLWKRGLPANESVASSFAGQVEYLDHTLDRALERIVTAYRPKRLGVMLSGGIDSKIIAFYARKFCNLTCLTWCFEDRNMDESKEAKDAAKYMGLDWIPIQISRNQPGLKRLDPTIRFAPEKHAFRPLKNRMYEEARSLGVDVLLNGVWGDQIFRPLHHRFVQLRRRARLKWRHLFRTPWLSRVVEKELVSSGLTSIRYSERYERSLLGPRACQSDSWEHLFFSRPDFQVVSPYRDVELISMMLRAKAEPEYSAPSKPHLRTLADGKVSFCVPHKMRRTSLEPLFVEILQANRYEMQAHIERFKPHLEPWIKPRVLEEWVKVGPNEGHFVPFWMAQTYATWQGQYG